MVPTPPKCYSSTMASFPTYKIVSAPHVADLEVEVNHHLSQGFELVGGPFPAHYGDKTFILQALLQPPAREEFELPT
ncbi:hypothetical protein BH09VER1_BH09VER1_32880 [soil metagenome]